MSHIRFSLNVFSRPLFTMFSVCFVVLPLVVYRFFISLSILICFIFDFFLFRFIRMVFENVLLRMNVVRYEMMYSLECNALSFTCDRMYIPFRIYRVFYIFELFYSFSFYKYKLFVSNKFLVVCIPPKTCTTFPLAVTNTNDVWNVWQQFDLLLGCMVFDRICLVFMYLFAVALLLFTILWFQYNVIICITGNGQ